MRDVAEGNAGELLGSHAQHDADQAQTMRQQALGGAGGLEQLERAGVDAQRAGFGRRRGVVVDDARGEAAPGKLQRRGEADGPGADDEDLRIGVGHMTSAGLNRMSHSS
jgi:hypothetical protein